MNLPPVMSTVLVVAVGEDHVAPARMPRELRRAGCRVAMLAPRDSYATMTQYIEKLAFLKPTLGYRAALSVVDAALREFRPEQILPADDGVLLALMRGACECAEAAATPVTAGPDAMATGSTPRPLWPEVAAMVERSLGPHAHYVESVDKVRLVDVARRAGLDVPAGDGAATGVEAVAIAKRLGYPVVVRPAVGSGSRGVAICHTDDDVVRAMAALPPVDARTWPQPAAPALVQAFLAGTRYNRATASWQGRELTGYTRTALQRRDELSAGTVSRFVSHPAIADATARLAAALQVSGFAGVQFIDDPATGRPCLIEINRRMVPATHAGRYVGIDVAAAWAGALHGYEWTGPRDMAPERATTMALFPQEWKRDPQSAHLTTLPVDAPWDDPLLFATMLGLARR
ncbi:MAG: ATP-grasp domain-containing protein [Proteobacteria bacterium]|nr:ATP-grasp domain-containing protein [Pseudomonadota bacterium]